MTRKKTLTKDAALLEALHSNLHLLGGDRHALRGRDPA